MPDELKYEDTPGPGHASTKIQANEDSVKAEPKSGNIVGDIVNRMFHGPSIFTTPLGNSEQEADLQSKRKARDSAPKYTGRGP